MRSKLKLMNAFFLASCVAMPAPLLAQTQPDSPASEEDANGIDEIIVTARKRAEDLQETPISIAAFTSKSLEARQVDNVGQVASFTPNLSFDTSSAISGTKSSASVFIRGVGQTDFVLSTDPGVGIYLDGVYISRSIGSVLDVVDVERIEVLRGPQGTLFGRNTIGGAISVTSKDPQPTFGGSASISTGSFNRFRAQAKLNIPLGDTLAVSLTGARFYSAGYIDRPNLGDKTGGDNVWSGRLSALWTPTDNLKVRLNVDATRLREKSCCNELVGANPNGFFALANNGFIFPPPGGTVPVPLSPSDPRYFDQRDLPTAPFQDNTDVDIPSDLDVFGASMTIDYDFTSDLSLKSITAYRDMHARTGRDLSHTSGVLFGETIDTYNHRQFSQELQLQGSSIEDRLKWIIGLYYFKESGANQDLVDFTPVVDLVSGGEIDGKSIAAFVQATFDVTDKLSFTGGLRFTKDDKSFAPAGYQYVISSSIGIPPGTLLVPNDVRSISDKQWLPLATVAYKWTDDFMTYATFSEGYKSGGFTQRVFPPLAELPSFNPEFVTVYEVGFKLTAARNAIRVNGAAFSTSYDDLQVLVQDVIAPVTRNAARARIRGFELELVAKPTRQLILEAGVGHLDAKYLQIDAAAAATGLTLGKRLVDTPKWSVNLGASYEFDIGGFATLTPRVDWTYKSAHANDAFNEPLLNQKGFGVLNAGVTLADLNDKWSLVVSGKNLTNKRYIQAGFADLVTQSAAEATFGRPREWTLTAKVNF